MLEVDHADDLACAEDGSAEDGLEVAFGDVFEGLEAWVVGGVGGDGDGLAALGGPSGDALSDLDAELVDQFGVGVLRGAQDELFAFEHVDEAGVTGDDRGDEVDNTAKNNVEGVCSCNAAADLVQKLNWHECIAEAGHGGG